MGQSWGAVVLRFLFIFLGIALLERFNWVFYLFGAFLLYTAYGMAFGVEKSSTRRRIP